MSKADIDAYVGWDKFTEEQQKVFKEAMFKSKGKSNNRLGAYLVLAGATADDVAKYGGGVDARSKFWARRSSERHVPKAVRQIASSVPDFWETVKGRKLKERSRDTLIKMGLNPDEKLPVTRFNAKLSEMYLQRTFKANGESYCMYNVQRDLKYDSSVGDKLEMVDVFEPLANVKFADDAALKNLMDCSVKKSTGSHNSLPDYDKNRKYEIDSFAHMDEAITSQINPYKLLIDVLHENYSGYFYSNPESSYAIQIMCIMEGFYDVCREMGIVGVQDKAISGRYWVSASTAKGIMQNVIKLAGSYRRLVKGGFAESVARETVLAEINENISNRAAHPQIRFYPRNDYVDTPEEEREQAKQASKSGSGSSRKTVMSIEELLGVKLEEA